MIDPRSYRAIMDTIENKIDEMIAIAVTEKENEMLADAQSMIEDLERLEKFERVIEQLGIDVDAGYVTMRKYAEAIESVNYAHMKD